MLSCCSSSPSFAAINTGTRRHIFCWVNSLAFLLSRALTFLLGSGDFIFELIEDAMKSGMRYDRTAGYVVDVLTSLDEVYQDQCRRAMGRGA